MQKKNDYWYIILLVISWIIFIGLCIEAGALIFNAIVTLAFEPAGTSKFWIEVNLNEVYLHNQRDFVTLISLIIITAVLRAMLFYQIIRVFHQKQLDLAKPFNEPMSRFIMLMAYLALGIGLFSLWGAGYAEGLDNQGVKLPSLEHLSLAAGDVWIFMGVILLVIEKMFKRGIAIQSENDLTI